MKAVSQQAIIRQEFKKELQGYYQMNGVKNGCPIEGTIYPPDIDKNDVALEQRVDKLSDFLSKQDGITYRPTPDFGHGRIQDRAKVAAAASGWVAASGKVALDVATDLISDPSIRVMVREGLKTCDEFYEAPSSKSGFFHPADEINKGGLALHTARVVAMGEHLGEFFGLDPHEQDIMRAGLILHDSVKGGEPWVGYADDHGELAGKMILHLHGPEDVKQEASKIACNHMALWRQTADRQPNPAVPDNKMDMIASLADYLAARDNLYLDVPGVDKSIPPTMTPEDRMKPQSYTGTTRNRDKAFPRGMDVTMEKESITVTVGGKSYTANVNEPEIKDAYVSYGEFTPDDKKGENELEGMSVKANFWLMTGARGGMVTLMKGDKEAEYFVRPPVQ